MPSAAGAPRRRRASAVETSTSTTIVITYGSAWKSSGAIVTPRAWSVNGSAENAPKKYAPTRQSVGPPEREDDERDRDPAGARR